MDATLLARIGDLEELLTKKFGSGWEDWDAAHLRAAQRRIKELEATSWLSTEPALWLTQKEFDVLSKQPKGDREIIPLYVRS